MFKGVLLGFACYAAYAISDAFVKSLHGTLPAYEAVFFGAVLMLSALPFIRNPGDRYLDVFTARKPHLWWIRAITGAICNISAVIAFTALPMAENITCTWPASRSATAGDVPLYGTLTMSAPVLILNCSVAR